MNVITVYHGGTERVEFPIVSFGRENLDFGCGFYVTDLREQAEGWAHNVARLRNRNVALLNVYAFDKESMLRDAKCKIFNAYDREWMQFIVSNRRGDNVAERYDYIEGGVANDRVINSINMYMQGYLSEEETLRRLSEHQPNNQICIRNQELIERHLRYERTEQI